MSSEDFDLNPLVEKVRNQKGINKGIVIYYAPWCPWCKMFKPDMNELSNHEKVYAINISGQGFDIEQERKILNNLTTVPAIFFYKPGSIPKKFEGSRDWKSILKAYKTFSA